MDNELALTVERIGRSRAARDARDADRLAPRNGARTSTSGALETGARVFDLVTGQEGEIVGSYREHSIVPATERRNG